MNSLSRIVLCALPLTTLPACGGGHDASAQQLEALQREIVKLRAETAILAERLDSVELAQGTFRGEGSKSSAAAGRGPTAGGSASKDDRPDLDVVRLAPDAAAQGSESELDADDEDGRPRTVIRSVSGGAVIEEKAAPKEPSAKGSAAAQRDYDQALELVRSRSYDRAIEAFTSFLARNPNHANADNAIYWRGESYLSKGEARRAAEQFEAVVTGYPKGNKVPDALLKLSVSLASIGDAAGAEAAQKKLKTTYPSSDAAKKLDRSAPAQSSPSSKTAGVKP